MEQQMLDDAQVSHYGHRGYVAPAFRFEAAAIEEMRAAVDRMLARSPAFADFCPELLAQDPLWRTVAQTPGLLDVVGQVIGDDIVLWGSGYFGKPGRAGKATPWHQDGEYWPIRPLATVTAWIALDPATPENGGLRVIPASHTARQLYPHDRVDSDQLTLNQVLSPRYFDEAAAVDIVLRSGEVSLHDVYMVHGSAANRSGLRRAGVTFRYMPASSHFDRDLAAGQHRRLGVPDISRRPLYLLRGSDTSGRNDLFAG